MSRTTPPAKDRARSWVRLGLSLAVALVAGCAGTPRPVDTTARPARSAPVVPLPADRDGPPDREPPDLARTPDAEPRIEPVRPGGPNKPYEVMGETYQPARGDPEIVERGLASWYGRAFHGRRTASGEVYDMFAMTAAHKTMPIPSYARVVNPANGREIVVRINDRGPFIKGRIIDLSYTAAVKLGVTRGVAPVEVSRITHEAIRTGRWRRDAADGPGLAATPAPLPVQAQAQAAGPAPLTRPVSDASAPVVAPIVIVQAAVPDAAPAVASTSTSTSLADPAPASPPGPAPAAEVVAAAPALASTRDRALTAAARGFWVQLGAFAQHDGAQAFRRRVEQEMTSLAPLLAVFADRQLHRLQVGPYGSRAEAQGAAEAVRATLQLVPVIVERR